MAEANLTLTLDAAASPLPADNSLDSGTFQPTNADMNSDIFPPPVPALNTNSALAAFNGLNPNGDWRLFIVDDSAENTGSIDSWELEITARVKTRKKR